MARSALHVPRRRLLLLSTSAGHAACTPCSLSSFAHVHRCLNHHTLLQSLVCCPFAQRAEEPHSMQSLLRCPCVQMPEPPHSLQLLLCRPCAQMAEPPHSLQSPLCHPCVQRLEPPHSLQSLLHHPCARLPRWHVGWASLASLAPSCVAGFVPLASLAAWASLASLAFARIRSHSLAFAPLTLIALCSMSTGCALLVSTWCAPLTS